MVHLKILSTKALSVFFFSFEILYKPFREILYKLTLDGLKEYSRRLKDKGVLLQT